MSMRRVLSQPQDPLVDDRGMITRQWAGLVRDIITRLSRDIETVSADYSATADDQLIICDATDAAFTVTLPAAAGLAGRVYTVKKVDATANAVTVDGYGSETIDGAASQSLAAQWDSITMVTDGEGWLIT